VQVHFLDELEMGRVEGTLYITVRPEVLQCANNACISANLHNNNDTL
jgi:hypothetical protein